MSSPKNGEASPAPADKAEDKTVEGAGAYENEEELKKLADIIRQKLKIRHGVLQENRVEYFKGKQSGWRM